jgi:hypothetical protein
MTTCPFSLRIVSSAFLLRAITITKINLTFLPKKDFH